MRLLKWILIAVGAVAGVFLVSAALRPSEFRIERGANMTAPPWAVFAQVNDFRRWREWSPWEKLDPALERRYEGPAGGSGARYVWKGNSDAGEGRMTILESRPGELVRIRLEFVKPFAATNTAEFAFKPTRSGTAVTWSMSGHNDFMARVFWLLMSVDRTVGAQFEEGLANMKAVVEKRTGS